MIIVLTGAKKNIGDYLIADRGIKLLKEFVDGDVIELDRFSPLDSSLDVVNSARAVVLCGGPAYDSDVYPGKYPLVANLREIRPLIYPFGLGWCGRPAGSPEKFQFSPSSIRFLSHIHDSIQYSSVRDPITHEILRRHSFDNVLMTGCPVWYDLDSIGKQVESRTDVQKIVFTTPDNPRLLFQVTSCVRLLRKLFPDAEIVCSFHRGIGADQHTSHKAAAGYKAMELVARLFDARSIDVSYDLKKIEFYEDCDLHVGYRVHAHLHFLSRRVPSALLCEDGRGVGMLRGLGTESINVWETDPIPALRSHLLSELKSDWTNVRSAVGEIDRNFEQMKKFLQSIADQ